jgi:superfamily II DNA or RNA helicase
MAQDARLVPAASRTSAHPLRAWQASALEAMASWRAGSFLVSAAPGAGKTRPAIEVALRLLRAREIQRVVLVCPTAPLTRQWAAAAGRLGLHLVPDAPGPRPPKDFHGVSVTYARIAGAPEAWAKGMGPGTLVIADEAHHLGEELAWGRPSPRRSVRRGAGCCCRARPSGPTRPPSPACCTTGTGSACRTSPTPTPMP